MPTSVTSIGQVTIPQHVRQQLGICRGNKIEFPIAWDHVLGQEVTDKKSNEITAIPALLKLLELKDCIATIDTMGCQIDIAEQVIEQEADYILV